MFSVRLYEPPGDILGNFEGLGQGSALGDQAWQILASSEIATLR